MARMEDVTYDVAIIGTGLYGIQAARYYLDVHHDAKLVLLEADDVIGGTWSSKRIYDGFWTQTPVGMAEFSDVPMTPPPAEDQYYGFFPAKYTSTYLESYVDNHTYAGKTIRDRVLLKSHVDSVTRFQILDSSHGSSSSTTQWTITYNTNKRIYASKIIDATGLTSQPYIPSLPGSSNFKGRTLHHKSFGQEEKSILSDPSMKNICVLGGAKSAADVAYTFAKASGDQKKNVHWIIREDGNGPSAFFSVQPTSARYANSNEGFYNRYLASYLPNPFKHRWGPLKWLLQWTILGRWHMERLWDGFDRGLRGLMDYQREEGKRTGFRNLEPDTPIFWQNDSSGVANRPDFLSTLATNVRIYRQNISHLSADSVTLQPRSASNREEKPSTIPIDALVFCTGWSASTTLFPPQEASALGLSVPLDAIDSQTQYNWQMLEKAADAVILSRFPTLRHPPDYRKIKPTRTPFRLYNSIAPPTDVHSTHSIVFLGKMVVGNSFCTAEAQALWTVAYLDGRIRNLPSQAQINKEIAETVAWDRRRYLNKGELGSWFYFDVVDYADALLEQLGLDSHRRKAWIGDLMDPFFASDLKDLGQEYKIKYLH